MSFTRKKLGDISANQVHVENLGNTSFANKSIANSSLMNMTQVIKEKEKEKEACKTKISKHQLQALLDDFDLDVETRCRQLETHAANLTTSVRNALHVELMKMPKKMREMKYKQFCGKPMDVKMQQTTTVKKGRKGTAAVKDKDKDKDKESDDNNNFDESLTNISMSSINLTTPNRSIRLGKLKGIRATLDGQESGILLTTDESGEVDISNDQIQYTMAPEERELALTELEKMREKMDLLMKRLQNPSTAAVPNVPIAPVTISNASTSRKK